MKLYFGNPSQLGDYSFHYRVPGERPRPDSLAGQTITFSERTTLKPFEQTFVYEGTPEQVQEIVDQLGAVSEAEADPEPSGLVYSLDKPVDMESFRVRAATAISPVGERP
jgi:hypothetical protein